jgi:hypothetical protein
MTTIEDILKEAFEERRLTGSIAASAKLPLTWACDAVREVFALKPELRIKTDGTLHAATLATTETDIPSTIEPFVDAVKCFVAFRYFSMSKAQVDQEAAAAEFRRFRAALGFFSE